jgi:hypothetical protein
LNNFETYTVLVASTSHVEENDIFILSGSYMTGERDTGIFIKLYEEKEEVKKMCEDLKLSIACTSLLVNARCLDNRMVELDCDGPVYDNYKTHKWNF